MCFQSELEQFPANGTGVEAFPRSPCSCVKVRMPTSSMRMHANGFMSVSCGHPAIGIGRSGTATSCQDLTGWPPEDVVLLAHLRLQRMIHCTESLLVAMCLEWKLTEKSPDVSPDEPQLQMIPHTCPSGMCTSQFGS